MKKIVVVEATSTGANYIADIIKRGYEPVILEPVISKEFRVSRGSAPQQSGSKKEVSM